MIEIKNLSKTFKTAAGEVEALKDVSLQINDGDIFGVIGMSGAGKSTLVRCINMLERPTDGQVIIDGVDIGSLSEKELREKRREITMIFQGFNLLMQRTNLRNVCFPLELAGIDKKTAKTRALELLDMVGLKDKANAYPAQLSGGQQQRVAIARALATSPKVLLCDEATSALDPSTTTQILDLIKNINQRLGITVIMITHSMNVVESACTRVAIIDGGKVVEQGEVAEIFSKPKTEAARKLVFPEGEEVLPVKIGKDDRFIRLVFNGDELAGQPLIARLAAEKGINASIVSATTKLIGDKTFGTMLLNVKGDYAVLAEVVLFFTNHGVIAEEVKVNDK